MNGRWCTSSWNINIFFRFHTKKNTLEFLYSGRSDCFFLWGLKQWVVSQTKLTHPESGCCSFLIFPDLPFLGRLKVLISCILAMWVEHMVCVKILVEHLSTNLTVGSAKEQTQESSQTLPSSPKQTHLPLKHILDLQV